MNALIQQGIVDAVVLAAALWLGWSFGPDSLRRWVRRRRRVEPAYDVALRAEGLAGEGEHPHGPDCACKDQAPPS